MPVLPHEIPMANLAKNEKRSSNVQVQPTEKLDFMLFDFENVCQDWLGLDYEEVMARE